MVYANTETSAAGSGVPCVLRFGENGEQNRVSFSARRLVPYPPGCYRAPPLVAGMDLLSYAVQMVADTPPNQRADFVAPEGVCVCVCVCVCVKILLIVFLHTQVRAQVRSQHQVRGNLINRIAVAIAVAVVCVCVYVYVYV